MNSNSHMAVQKDNDAMQNYNMASLQDYNAMNFQMLVQKDNISLDDSYLCYHEPDPKAMKQQLTSIQRKFYITMQSSLPFDDYAMNVDLFSNNVSASFDNHGNYLHDVGLLVVLAY